MNIRPLKGFAMPLALIMSVAGSSVGFAQSNSESSSSSSEDEIVLEKFEVTGSRIKRLDVEGPQPVVDFSRQDILDTGYNNLGDFIQTLPFNSGGVNFLTEAASFTRGAQTANLRGLGGSRFLTLVNGRRVSAFALSDGGQRSVFDFSSIPAEAIEKIEFLKDGASAIYGSDAITGVLDIKLRKDFVGMSISAQYGNTIGHDSGGWQMAGTFGAANGKTSIMGSFSWSESNSNYIRDYDRSTSVDYSYLGVKGQDNRSSFNFPANVPLSAAQAAAAGLTAGSGFYTISAPSAAPTTAQFVPVFRASTVGQDGFARFEFANVYQLFPSTERYGVFSRMEHEITDSLKAIVELGYNSSYIPFDFTPAVVNAAGTPGTAANGSLRISKDNPYNPFGFDVTSFRYRTSFLPNRGFENYSKNTRLLAALEGQIGSYDWDWASAVVYSGNDVTSISTNAIRATDLQAALDGTTLDTALNPWGPTQNQAIIDGLGTSSQDFSSASSTIWDASVSGTPFDMPTSGESVGVAVGVEVRREELEDRPDTSAYVGSGGGSPFIGSRDVYSIFAEMSVPILKGLEAQFAVRYEDYSDFGDTTKPKYALAYRPEFANWVKIRASYSEAFKAPDLAQLFSAQQTSFSGLLNDPLRPQDPSQQMQQVSGGNPNLQPEEATVAYAGAVFDLSEIDRLPEWAQGFSFSADFFNIKVEDVISTPSANTILSRPAIFPDQQFVVRDNTAGYPGPIRFIRTTPANVSQQRWRGWDLGVNYRYNTVNLGTFRTSWNFTYTDVIGQASSTGGFFENQGLWNNPRLNATASVSWNRKDWSASVFTTYTGGYLNDAYSGLDEKPHVVINPSFSYSGFAKTKITIGANNVFDRDPPANGYELEGYDSFTYSGLGRYVYVRLEKDF